MPYCDPEFSLPYTFRESPVVAKVFPKDLRDIRNEVTLESVHDPVAVTALAVHDDQDQNSYIHLPCGKFTPIGGYVYSAIDDTCAVHCMEYVSLGVVPLSYVARMKSAVNWEMRVPMPESVLKRYLSPTQKRRLFHFKGKYKGCDGVKFHYVQMLSAF